MKHTRLVLAGVMLFALIGMVSAVSPGLPMVNFTGVPTTGPAPLTVDFTSVTQNITLIKNTWSFGDGWQQTQISDPTITHVYQNPGKYDVTLEAENLIGSLGYTMTKTDYIYVTHVRPDASFTLTFDPDNPGHNSPLEVTFTSTTTGFEPVLHWILGDGSEDTRQTFTRTFYNDVGTPQLVHNTLEAINDGGQDSSTESFTINPPQPEADFGADSSTTGPVPLAVQFRDESEGAGAMTYSWDFGDNQTSTQEDPLHAYGAIGLYDVSLKVTTPYGNDTETKEHYVNVTAVLPPVVCPTPEPTPEPTQCPAPSLTLPKIGIYKDGIWYLDADGNGAWNTGDKAYSFGAPGWISVTGDWDGNGITEVGVSNGQQWYLDYNGNGVWDTGIDKSYSFGATGWMPIVGDWDLNGKTEIGIYKDGIWYLDYNGNGVWNAGTDKQYTFGTVGWLPLEGKWI